MKRVAIGKKNEETTRFVGFQGIECLKALDILNDQPSQSALANVVREFSTSSKST